MIGIYLLYQNNIFTNQNKILKKFKECNFVGNENSENFNLFGSKHTSLEAKYANEGKRQCSAIKFEIISLNTVGFHDCTLEHK